jgi:competence protein ComEC
MISFWVVWRNKKKSKALQLFLLCMTCVLVVNAYTALAKYRDSYFVVHQIKGKTAVSCVTNKQALYFLNDTLSSKEYNYAIKPLLAEKDVCSKKLTYIKTRVLEPIKFNNQYGIIINGDCELELLADYISGIKWVVITSKVSQKKIHEIITFFKDKRLIFDSSFSMSFLYKLQDKYKSGLSNMHFVPLQGAFVVQE